MPTYNVEFLDPAGAPVRAALNAPSLPVLASRLHAQGHTLQRLLPSDPPHCLRGYARRVSEGEVTTFLRQLAAMLENGVSVPEALRLQARETANPTLRAVLSDVERSVRDGGTLASALEPYPRMFSPLFTRLIESAEQGSMLPVVLRQLAEYADRTSQASLRIRTALVYPQVVGAFTLLVMLAITVFVQPKFIELFTELGVKENGLPLATRALQFFSTWVVPAGMLIVPPAAIGVWLWWRREERRAPFRWAHLRGRIPIFGALYHHFAMLRLSLLLAALLRGGIPLPEALRLAGQGAESPLLQAAMWDAIPRVNAGEPLAGALGHSGILPPTFVGQIAGAETSGDLPGTLEKLAEWYSDRVDFLSARVGAILEPVLILFLAVMAGWVAVGVFLPLIGVIQSLSGGK